MYLLNSVNPFRVEGQKTIVFEMLQQRDWQTPDWIVLPAGNLGNTSAFGKALHEFHQLGLIEKMPRLACVQAAGANPFYKSYDVEFSERYTVAAHTLATAIRIGNPVSHERAVRALRWTDGVVTEVSDQEIMEAKAEIDASGIGCEPASASSLAGLRKFVAAGVIDPRRVGGGCAYRALAEGSGGNDKLPPGQSGWNRVQTGGCTRGGRRYV